MSLSEYEKIYAVFDYYDGIRTGIADFKGAHHYYERPFDEARGDWADYFLLKPIDEETFRLALEDWAIWQRWYAACQARETTVDTHPALPEDRARHEEIQAILKRRLVVNPATDVKAQGDVRRVDEGRYPAHGTNPFARLRIKWREVA
jgi:hypothetical protein